MPRYLPEYNLISIKDFCHVNLQEKVLIDNLIEKNYLNSKGIDLKGYSFPLYDDHISFFSHLYEKYKKLCYELFGNFNITPQNKTTCWCYRSNVNDSQSVWHNHLCSSTINGVYYYQVEGDGITFTHKGKEFHHVPQQGELLIFPNDLFHKPDIATSDNWRYSINMELMTQESASTLFKKYGFS